MEKRICGMKSCQSGMDPTRQPVVSISGFGKNAPTADIILGMALCEPCAAVAKASDFISDEGWAVMHDTFYKAFHRNPVRQSLKVRFQDFIEVKEFIEKQKALQAEQTRKAREMVEKGEAGIVKPELH